MIMNFVLSVGSLLKPYTFRSTVLFKMLVCTTQKFNNICSCCRTQKERHHFMLPFRISTLPSSLCYYVIQELTCPSGTRVD